MSVPCDLSYLIRMPHAVGLFCQLLHASCDDLVNLVTHMLKVFWSVKKCCGVYIVSLWRKVSICGMLCNYQSNLIK
jgi:hypothetical protein